MDAILNVIKSVNGFVWGPPMLVLLVGTGIYLTIALKGLQIRRLLYSLYLALIKRKEDSPAEGEISHFEALMTALSATVGTGNIVGVATAIMYGGPGALFWMWITGLFGMATKYSEALLAVKFRKMNRKGEIVGGPMYYLTYGAKQKWLGALFAIFASVAAFGIGCMVQSNSIASAISDNFHIPRLWVGIVLFVGVALVILGGIKQIGKVTSFLVPFMILFYVIAAVAVIVINIKEVPNILHLVIKYAFTPMAAAGGVTGFLVKDAIRYGVARGVFSNESGLGSSPIAAAAAQTKKPVTQALVSMTQTFIDTIVVCSMTGIVILMSGLWSSGKFQGAKLTSEAFNSGLSSNILGSLVVTIGIALFAYSTILGWSYYGEKSIEFLFGTKIIYPYRFLFCVFAFLGTILKIEFVWQLADTMNGLMAVPNLIGLLVLSPIIIRESREYFRELK